MTSTIQINKDFLLGGVRAPLQPVKLSREEMAAFEICQAYLLIHCPFFANLYYNQLSVVFTHGVVTAATDGFTIFINPLSFFKYDVHEQVFILCHEIMHCIYNDCGQSQVWQKSQWLMCPGGRLPYVDEYMNAAMDYTINALLIDAKVGKYNKNWLFDYSMSAKGMEHCSVVYEKLYAALGPPPPPPPGGKPGDKPGNNPGGQPGGNGPPPPPGGSMPGNGQDRFDQHLQPGAAKGEDPDKAQEGRNESEWRVAVAAAARAAEAQGKLPAGLKRFIGDILEPKVSWQDQVRAQISRRMGTEGYDWTTLDDRMLNRDVIGFEMIAFPQQSEFECGTIAIGVDTSGSISKDIIERFFGEMAGIVADLKPRHLVVLWCDAAVDRVDEMEQPEDLLELKASIDKDGVPGGGGTDFRPVFTDIAEKEIEPELLVYFTDLYGTFPKKKPDYPVVWACINEKVAPFGDTVQVEL